MAHFIISFHFIKKPTESQRCPLTCQDHPMQKVCPQMTTVLCLVSQSYPTLQPHGQEPTRLLCPWGFSRHEYWSGLPCPPPGDLPNPGIKPKSPTLQADCLPSESPEKPKNTGTGSLSLLQGIFLIQGLNRGLLVDSLPDELPGKPQMTITE